LIRIKILPESLQYVRPAPPWYAGILFNIQGRKAVKNGLKKGGESEVVFLGTDHVDGLKRSIETAFAD